jgi:hypothetical protein
VADAVDDCTPYRELESLRSKLPFIEERFSYLEVSLDHTTEVVECQMNELRQIIAANFCPDLASHSLSQSAFCHYSRNIASSQDIASTQTRLWQWQYGNHQPSHISSFKATPSISRPTANHRPSPMNIPMPSNTSRSSSTDIPGDNVEHHRSALALETQPAELTPPRLACGTTKTDGIDATFDGGVFERNSGKVELIRHASPSPDIVRFTKYPICGSFDYPMAIDGGDGNVINQKRTACLPSLVTTHIAESPPPQKVCEACTSRRK